jgi:hypothetical protein
MIKVRQDLPGQIMKDLGMHLKIPQLLFNTLSLARVLKMLLSILGTKDQWLKLMQFQKFRASVRSQQDLRLILATILVKLNILKEQNHLKISLI